MHARHVQTSIGLVFSFCGAIFAAPGHDEMVNRALTIMDVVLEHHVDPPTRQEMALGGARALFRAAQMPQPVGLSQRVSRLNATEEIGAFLVDALRETAIAAEANNLEETLLHGITGVVSGRVMLVSAKQFKVDQQLAANRYIGIGIVLAFDKDSGFPQIKDTFARGSAYLGGAQNGDFITSIDGKDAHQMRLARAIDLLRGQEGTSVTITVRQPKEKETRKLVIPRTVVPRQTVRGYESRGKEEWTYRIKSNAPVAYVRISDVGSSTVHELRQLERELKADGIRALMLDLQGYQDTRLNETALVADALLDGGVIGQVRTSKGVRKYEADSDCLFRDWPMAVLISEFTAGGSEWLAAALQDQKRAVVVGRPTAGQGLASSHVALPDGGAIILTTAMLERGDGSSLLAPGPTGQGVRVEPPRGEGERKNGVKPDHLVPNRSRHSNAQFSPDGSKRIIDHREGEISTLYTHDGREHRTKVIDPVVSKALELLEEAIARDGVSQQTANATE